MPGVIVAGSYPPIPVPASGATVDAVRRALDEGREVTVVSPRPSAAHVAAPLVGLMAGRRLDRIRRLTGRDRLVLCLEAGVPFRSGATTGAPPAARMRAGIAARLLAAAMGRFEHVTLVVAADDVGPPAAVARLRRAADEVVEDVRSGAVPAGVTTRGPVELKLADRVRHLGGVAGRRLLGPARYEALRRPST